MAPASGSRKWHWIMEYLVELKDLETSLVKDMIHNIPDYWCDIPEGPKERLCLRYLEQSLEDGQTCIPFASPPIVGKSVDLKKGMSSEAVLSRLFRKKAVTLHDPEKHKFEFSRKDVQNFVQRQKKMLPKKCLDLIEESIVQGRFPVNLNRGAEAENHCRSCTNAEFEAVRDGSFKTSGKFTPQKQKMSSPARSTDKALAQQDEASNCKHPLIGQNCIDSRENVELDHTHVTTQNTCFKQLDKQCGNSRQDSLTASRDKDVCIDSRENAELDHTHVTTQNTCSKKLDKQSGNSRQVSIPASCDKDVCIDGTDNAEFYDTCIAAQIMVSLSTSRDKDVCIEGRRENAVFDDTCVTSQIACVKHLEKQSCDSRQVSLTAIPDKDVCIDSRENGELDDTCVSAQITCSKQPDKQSCDSRQVSLTARRDKDVCIEDRENAEFDYTRVTAHISSSKQSDSRQVSLTAIRDKDVRIDNMENAKFDDTCLTAQITLSKQLDKQICDSRPVSLTASRNKVVGQNFHLDGREVVIPHVPSPRSPNGSAGSVSDQMEETSCMKCGKSGLMLSCSICLITVHEGCLASAANVGETGCFFCPWCSYSKAREEHDTAKGIFSRAKEEFSRAKDVLANFIKSNVHVPSSSPPDGNAGSTSGDLMEEASCIKCGRSGIMLSCGVCFITVHEGCLVSAANVGETGCFCCPWCSYNKAREEHGMAMKIFSRAKEKISQAKDVLASFIKSNAHDEDALPSPGDRKEECPAAAPPSSTDAHPSMEIDHGGAFSEGGEAAKVFEVAFPEEHQLSSGIHAVCNNEDSHQVDNTANNGLLNRRENENPRPQSGCISLKDETCRDIVLFVPRKNREAGNIGLHEADEYNTSPECINRKQKRRKLVGENSEGFHRRRPISVNQAKENPSSHGHVKFRPLLNRSNPIILSGSNPVVLSGRRKKLDWSSEEEEYLKSAVGKLKMKEGDLYPWTRILESGCRVFHNTRKPSDLRIKWRNILHKENPGHSNVSKASPDA